MKFIKKILVLLTILVSILAPLNGNSLTAKAADSIEELRIKIVEAEQRVEKAKKQLLAIDQQKGWLFIYGKYGDAYNETVNFFLQNFRDEYSEYINAACDVEDLRELEFYAIMNELSNKQP